MANRQYQGNLGLRVSETDVKRGVLVADPLKVDAELTELATRLAYTDPSATGKWGNFDATVIFVTTPSTANTEFAVQHALGRTPVGCSTVLPLASKPVMGGVVGLPVLERTRAADATYLYLSSPNTLYAFGLVVW